MMNCKHENKKLISYSYHNGLHDSTYKCNECGDFFTTIDAPIMYSYPPKMVTVYDVQMHEEDYEIIKEKEAEIKTNTMEG